MTQDPGRLRRRTGLIAMCIATRASHINRLETDCFRLQRDGFSRAPRSHTGSQNPICKVQNILFLSSGATSEQPTRVSSAFMIVAARLELPAFLATVTRTCCLFAPSRFLLARVGSHTCRTSSSASVTLRSSDKFVKVEVQPNSLRQPW